MKKGKNIAILALTLLGIMLLRQAERAYAAETGNPRWEYSGYRYLAENRQDWQADKRDGSTVSSSVSAHKVLGYCTLGFGLAAMTTGIIDHVDRDRGRKPPRAQQIIHAAASYGTAALAVSACTSGFIQYGNIFSLDKSKAKYNAHVILGLVSTAGFIGSIVSAKIDGRRSHRSSGGQYVHHTWVAAGSGAVMMLSIVVMYF